MAPYFSFRPALRAAMEAVKPKAVLEWGPGQSTKLMLEYECVEALMSIEHKVEWQDVWRREISDRRWYMFMSFLDEYAKLPLIFGVGPDPLDVKFDLVFVDGRRRPECLDTAKKIIHQESIVLIHDAERDAYYDSIQSWPYFCWSHCGTVAVMSNSQSVMNEWREQYGKQSVSL